MNHTSTKPRLLPLAAALLLSTAAMGAIADTSGSENTGYWTTSDGSLLRSGNADCMRTGSWTPAAATAECDADLMPKTAAADPTPPARAEPETVAAAPAAPVPEERAEPVAAAPLPVAEKVAMNANVLFDFDQSTIKPEGKEALNEFIRKLNEAGTQLELIVSTGHTDSTGTTAYNADLSLRRAEAVKAYLVSNGIDTNDIKTAGMGESQPSADNATAEGRSENRRVQIEVTSTIR
jgi:OmpA-OmpF porin, OOP family